MLKVDFAGNYTMFDMVRPMLPGEYGMGRMMDDRMYKPEATLIESAWERGNLMVSHNVFCYFIVV